MNPSTRNRISILILIIFAGAILVQAQVIGPSGIIDFPWGNFTRVNTAHFYLNGTDYSANIVSSGTYDQVLNTTSSVTFAELNVSSKTELNSELDVVATINVNFEWSGTAAKIQAGENIAAGELVYIDAAGHLKKADADADTTVPCIGIAVEAINNGVKGTILMQGWIYNVAWTLNEGDYVFVSTTAGAIATTAPSGSGDQVQVVGIGLTEDLMWFNPDYTVMEIT